MIQNTTNNKKLQELLTYGVEKVIVLKDLEKKLKSGKKLRVKFGIDPTSPKIHLGRAIALRKLREFQNLGHKIILIIGDFTAQIGDSSDKLSKRPFLSKKDIDNNLKNYLKQIGKIINIKKAEIHYNSKWLSKMRWREIADLEESFTINQMLSRRNFKDRFKKREEISLRELSYPLMQGYDSVAVRADVEIGGFDQLFNIKAGRVIQKHYNQTEQNIIVTQMLEGLDNRKMSSSWGNTVNITDNPQEQYGKLMTLDDSLIEKYFNLCTDIKSSDIKSLIMKNPRDAKMKLAYEIVKIYHSEKQAKKAENDFISKFQKKEIPKNIPEIKLSGTKFPKIDLIKLLNKTKMALSINEAKRLIKQGGVKIDKEKITKNITIAKKSFVLQVGKKKFAKIIIQ